VDLKINTHTQVHIYYIHTNAQSNNTSGSSGLGVSASTENEAHGLIFLYSQPFAPRDKKENINKSSGSGEERQHKKERSVLLIYKRKKQLP
jgi:hypothetical protein